ncbi:MAG: flagellar assembly peptidoglycan hydrolase FlgJ [Pseudohongiellaceae bacterium]
MVTQVNVNDVYTNLSGLNSIKAAGREDASQGLKQVAKQFEGLFVNMMLKTMRDSNKAFSEGNYLSSNEMQIHQQNFDNQLSVHLTAGEGIGLADVLYRQLMQQYEVTEDSATEQVSSISFETPEDFVEQILPFAEKAGKELGVDPKFLIAQSALESGWGSKLATDSRGAPSNNLFGIKADSSWDGPVASAKTLEFEDGVAVQQRANFRKYDNVAASFSDYVSFLKSNPRYQSALTKGADSMSFAQALQEAGYATDPKYAEKISAVMGSSAIQSKTVIDKRT